MQISLSKNSDVPLHRQLAEQIVFLITSGKLKPSQQLASVRSLARQLRVHHNTVSKAYQDLVRRGWLRRQRGSRLYVGLPPEPPRTTPRDLDELINESIRRAREMGYSLQELRARVWERLLAQSPDHILIVEDEAGLRDIIRAELRSKLALPLESCTLEQFCETPDLAVGAQIVALEYALPTLRPLLSHRDSPLSLTVAEADDQVSFIRGLPEPSLIAVVSVSDIFLKTARSLLAPVIGRRHSLRQFKVSGRRRLDLPAVDIALCDSLSLALVRCRRKIHYRLIAADCLSDLAAAAAPPKTGSQ